MRSMGMTFGGFDDGKTFILFSHTKQYEITKFQRIYTWGAAQVNGIIKDIEYIEKTGESVGWPSVLIQEKEKSEPNVTGYYLGDGQQRITSVALALAAIRACGRFKKN